MKDLLKNKILLEYNKMKSQIENLLNVKCVLEHLCIGRTTLWRLTKKQNGLPYVKIGSRTLFKVDDINNLIKQNYQTP